MSQVLQRAGLGDLRFSIQRNGLVCTLDLAREASSPDAVMSQLQNLPDLPFQVTFIKNAP